jgi:hypothetical protein
MSLNFRLIRLKRTFLCWCGFDGLHKSRRLACSCFCSPPFLGGLQDRAPSVLAQCESGYNSNHKLVFFFKSTQEPEEPDFARRYSFMTLRPFVSKLRTSIGLLSLLGIFFFLACYYHIHSTSTLKHKEALQKEAQKAALEINNRLLKLAEIGDNLARVLGEPGLQDIETILRIEAEEHPDIHGIGAAYFPGKHNQQRELYAPYYVRDSARYKLLYIDEKYDYTSSQYLWWDLTVERRVPLWHEPFYGEASKAYLAVYTVPIFKLQPDNSKELIGVVFVNYCVDDLRRMMASLKIGKTGFGTIISPTGKIIYHPEQKYVVTSQTIFTVAEKAKSSTLKKIGDRAIAGESNIEDYRSSHTGQDMWFLFEPVPATGWSLNLLADKDELDLSVDLLRNIVFGAIISGMVFFISLCGCQLTDWRTIISTSVIVIGGIVLIWIMMEGDSFTSEKIDLKMVNKASLNKFIENYRNDCLNTDKAEAPLFIPTGVFIQSMRFDSANNVIVTGYIWQDYSDMPGGLKKGVILPEAEESKFKKAFKKGDTHGWYFKANLRERFDYSKYPFDREHVWLRMWPKQFDRNIVLIPDFESYLYINPTNIPGVEKDFVLAGWNIKSSFYNFKYNKYNSNLGIKTFTRHEFPELYFNVSLQRQFLNPFVRHLIPLAVVVVILFFILMVQRQVDEQGLYGFSSLNAVLGCSALFFVVIFNHISIREELASSRVVYMEFFYFITYIAILYVSVNSFFVARYAHYNATLSRMLFFPVLLMMLFGLTVLEFW